MKQRQRFHAAENSALNAELAQRNYELEQENAALREQLAQARAAAFKDAITAVKAMPVLADASGAKTVRERVVFALEAAANEPQANNEPER